MLFTIAKSFVVTFYKSSFCLWEVSTAVIHGGIRSTSIEKSFSIVVRLLKSQIWSNIVYISGMSITFTFWKSRSSWYCLIKYPALASVKTLQFLDIMYFLFFCWTVLSTSSIRHQHPLRTLMQIAYFRAQFWFSCVFGCDAEFVVHTHVLWLAVHFNWAGTN